MKQIAHGFGLLEGARWYEGWGLVFSDMTGGGVFCMATSASRPDVVIPHRKGVGGLVLHEDGGFVVAGRNVAYKASDGSTTVLLETRADEQFFNDLTADAEGRIYVGSVAIDPLGAELPEASALGRLYRIDVSGSVTVLAEDVVTSNGLGTDPSGSILYHVDTGRRLVSSFAIGDADCGGRQQFVDTSEYAGEPDGLAVGEDGSVWVAMAGGGLVVAWDHRGRRVTEIAVPQLLATAVCFGGEDRSTLYVLTGSTPQLPDPIGGCIYIEPVPSAGLPSPVAQVRMPK
jgi:D-xylonolactonase